MVSRHSAKDHLRRCLLPAELSARPTVRGVPREALLARLLLEMGSCLTFLMSLSLSLHHHTANSCVFERLS